MTKNHSWRLVLFCIVDIIYVLIKLCTATYNGATKVKAKGAMNTPKNWGPLKVKRFLCRKKWGNSPKAPSCCGSLISLYSGLFQKKSAQFNILMEVNNTEPKISQNLYVMVTVLSLVYDHHFMYSSRIYTEVIHFLQLKMKNTNVIYGILKKPKLLVINKQFKCKPILMYEYCECVMVSVRWWR